MRIKTPVTNPIYYARVKEMLLRAHRQVRLSEKITNEAYRREELAREAANQFKEERDLAKSVITDREFDIASLKRELEAKPMGEGRHSDLVMQLVEKVLARGNSDFRYNSNSADEQICPHCGSYVRITSRWDALARQYVDTTESIEHEKDCAYDLAQAIKDSQPED